jgi:hypothetical protein
MADDPEEMRVELELAYAKVDELTAQLTLLRTEVRAVQRPIVNTLSS